MPPRGEQVNPGGECARSCAGVELRFEGSEELGYDPLGTPPKGEICLRGPIIFQGYYEDKKKTEEAFGAPVLWGQHPVDQALTV